MTCSFLVSDRTAISVFNEPDDHFETETHCVDLTEATIQANKRFFASEADVPRKAYSMGIGNIMNAKTVLLVANGKNKAKALAAAITDRLLRLARHPFSNSIQTPLS